MAAARDCVGGKDQIVTGERGQKSTTPATADAAADATDANGKVKEWRQERRRKRGGVHLQSRNYDADTASTAAASNCVGGKDRSIAGNGGQKATTPATAAAVADGENKEVQQGQRRKRGGVHLQSRNSDVAFLERVRRPRSQYGRL
jgi:hypothetical protein